jgi:hypothetical protein
VGSSWVQDIGTSRSALRTIWLEHVGVVEVPMPDISTGDKMPTMPASGQRVANLFDNARKWFPTVRTSARLATRKSERRRHEVWCQIVKGTPTLISAMPMDLSTSPLAPLSPNACHS